MNKSFCCLFRLTTVCNKHCFLCCNNYDKIRKKAVLDFDDYLEKIRDIKEFCSSKQYSKTYGSTYIMFTGGEPFFYGMRDKDNNLKTLFEIVNATKREIPEARIVIKTSGFDDKNEALNRLLNKLFDKENGFNLEVRLGFSLYQNSGENAEERLTHMLRCLMSHQKIISIDTIYDKTNLEKTCQIIEGCLNKFKIPIAQNFLLTSILEDAHKRRRFIITSKNYKIFLDVGPAYFPNGYSNVNEYANKSIEECPVIKYGPDCLYFDTDLTLIHCNDPYVDASIPGLELKSKSTAEQLNFLCERFQQLNKTLTHGHAGFPNRKERCFFCSRYVMSAANGKPPIEVKTDD